jgi:hypothetical protein
MADNKVQDYSDDRNEGHVDTREANFECENKDKNLGCDHGNRCRRITERTVPYDRNCNYTDNAGILHQQMYGWPDFRSQL